jgi:hypothetical protein
VASREQAPASAAPRDADWEDWDDEDSFQSISGGGRHRSNVSRGSSDGARRQTSGARSRH